MKKKYNSKIHKISPLNVGLFCGLILFILVFGAIIYFTFINSLKFDNDFLGVGSTPNLFGLPREWTLKNWVVAFKGFAAPMKSTGGANIGTAGFLQLLLYSFLYAFLAAFMLTTSCCIMGYATGRFKVWTNKIIYGFVIIAMVLPVVGALPAQVDIMESLGIYNTWFGVVVSKFNFISVYYMIFHATFSSIPMSYTEAAKIDGAGNLRILVQIMLPLVRITFVTIFLLNFVALWNDYSGPMVFLKGYPNIAVGLYYFQRQTDGVINRIWLKQYSGGKINSVKDTPVQLAAAVITLIPVVILFLTFRKQLIGNISMGGLKE